MGERLLILLCTRAFSQPSHQALAALIVLSLSCCASMACRPFRGEGLRLRFLTWLPCRQSKVTWQVQRHPVTKRVFYAHPSLPARNFPPPEWIKGEENGVVYYFHGTRPDERKYDDPHAPSPIQWLQAEDLIDILTKLLLIAIIAVALLADIGRLPEKSGASVLVGLPILLIISYFSLQDLSSLLRSAKQSCAVILLQPLMGAAIRKLDTPGEMNEWLDRDKEETKRSCMHVSLLHWPATDSLLHKATKHANPEPILRVLLDKLTQLSSTTTTLNTESVALMAREDASGKTVFGRLLDRLASSAIGELDVVDQLLACLQCLSRVPLCGYSIRSTLEARGLDERWATLSPPQRKLLVTVIVDVVARGHLLEHWRFGEETRRSEGVRQGGYGDFISEPLQYIGYIDFGYFYSTTCTPLDGAIMGGVLAGSMHLESLRFGREPDQEKSGVAHQIGGLGALGAFGIARGLLQSVSLTTLELPCCNIGDTGAMMLSVAIEGNKRLRLVELDLRSCSIKRAGEYSSAPGCNQSVALAYIQNKAPSPAFHASSLLPILQIHVCTGGLTLASAVKSKDSLRDIKLLSNALEDSLIEFSNACQHRIRDKKEKLDIDVVTETGRITDRTLLQKKMADMGLLHQYNHTTDAGVQNKERIKRVHAADQLFIRAKEMFEGSAI